MKDSSENIDINHYLESKGKLPPNKYELKSPRALSNKKDKMNSSEQNSTKYYTGENKRLFTIDSVPNESNTIYQDPNSLTQYEDPNDETQYKDMEDLNSDNIGYVDERLKNKKQRSITEDSLNLRDDDFFNHKKPYTQTEFTDFDREDKQNESFHSINEDVKLDGYFSLENANTMYRKASHLNENEMEFKIRVVTPTKIGNIFNQTIFYTVTGKDDSGEFNIQRRYNDFYRLSQMLYYQFPGYFIPCLPEKKMMILHDDAFIEERRIMLENFCMRVMKTDHLRKSECFKQFLRLTDRENQWFNWTFTGYDKYYTTAMCNESYRNAINVYGTDIGAEIDTHMVTKLKNYKEKLEKMKNMMIEWRNGTHSLLKCQIEMREASKKFVISGENVENVIRELKGIKSVDLFKSKDFLEVNHKKNLYDSMLCFKLFLKIEVKDFENMISSITLIEDLYKQYKNVKIKLSASQKKVDDGIRNESLSSQNREQYNENLRKDHEKITQDFSNIKNLMTVAMNIMYLYEAHKFWIEKNERIYYINRLLSSEFRDYHKGLHQYWDQLNERSKVFYNQSVSEE